MSHAHTLCRLIPDGMGAGGNLTLIRDHVASEERRELTGAMLDPANLAQVKSRGRAWHCQDRSEPVQRADGDTSHAVLFHCAPPSPPYGHPLQRTCVDKVQRIAGIDMRTQNQTIDFARWLARHSEMAWFVFRERRHATVDAPERDLFVASDEPPNPFRPCSEAAPTGEVIPRVSPATISWPRGR
jgi:hypothetical protein